MFSERLDNSDDLINLPIPVKSPTSAEYTGEVIYEENEDQNEPENTDEILVQSKQNSKLGVRFSLDDEISIRKNNNQENQMNKSGAKNRVFNNS